jgi:O-antigen/teichoic acid export membrane protein
VRDFGVFALAWTTVILVNNLQIAFVVSPMMSVGPKQEAQERPTYYGAVLAQEMAFALCVTFVVWVTVALLNVHFPQWNIRDLGLPLAFATLAYLLQDFVRRYFFSTRQAKMALICDSISYVTQLPIIFFMARRSHLSPGAALWVIGATSLGGFLVSFIWFEPVRLEFQSLRQVTSRHWRISRWLAPSAFMQWGSGNLFGLVAPVYYGAAAAGVLRAAQNIVAVTHIWYLGLDNVVPAEAARQMHAGGVEACTRYIRQIVWRWGAITAAFLFLAVACPSLWLRLIYGTAYAGYGHILQLYAALYLMIFFGGPLRAGLQALEYAAPIFWSYLAMTAFSIAFAGPFAKNLGLVGAMLGMIATQVLFQGIVGAAFVLRLRRMKRTEFTNRQEVMR